MLKIKGHPYRHLKLLNENQNLSSILLSTIEVKYREKRACHRNLGFAGKCQNECLTGYCPERIKRELSRACCRGGYEYALNLSLQRKRIKNCVCSLVEIIKIEEKEVKRIENREVGNKLQDKLID